MLNDISTLLKSCGEKKGGTKLKLLYLFLIVYRTHDMFTTFQAYKSENTCLKKSAAWG